MVMRVLLTSSFGRVVSLLANNMDRECRHFLCDGDFGRQGVLFKFTVTEFRYTFVAKAVLADDRYMIRSPKGFDRCEF